MGSENHVTQLADNVEIPCVGFGTYLISDAEAQAAVAKAISVGYRHVDTAEGYENEAGVGAGIQRGLESEGLTREQMFVTTKLWPGNPAWNDTPKTTETTISSLNESLSRLNLDYVDLYLIHAPFCAVQRLEQWQGLVELHRQGKAKAIGVSNYNVAHIEEIKVAGLPLPDANQVELHPWSQKRDLACYLSSRGITAIAYSSLAPLSTWRAAKGQDSAKTEQMQSEGNQSGTSFKTMAMKYDVSEAQVLLRWGIQNGYPVLPKSLNPDRMRQNLDLFSFSIDDKDMASIAKLDRGGGLAWPTGDPVDSK